MKQLQWQAASELVDVAAMILERVPLYEGQPDLREMLDRLDAEAFVLTLAENIPSGEDGRNLQINGIFPSRAIGFLSDNGASA